MTASVLDAPPSPAPPARPTPPPPGYTPPRRRLRERFAGAPDDPAWARPSLYALLTGTALLYLWGLGASGTANSFYAAAVQAGTKSWKAFLFGSIDSSNFITVDKPPASLWVMELSGRIFGFSSWSMLAPQAIEGVLAVALVYGAVRRLSGHGAGLAAGAMLALTPAATLMFRFNNPDALLVLLMVAGAYAVVRALEAASTRWLMLAGVAIGFGFITKMGQALLVVPAFGLVYLVAAPNPLRRRVVQLLAALVTMIVSAGWWYALVQVWPASSRPYIGGSTDNSALELAFGYNGLGRLFGASAGSSGGAGNGGGANFGGSPGITRLFNVEMAGMISWLLPAALVALVLGLWATRSAPRTDRTRAGLLLWGGWLVVTGLVFSYMQGTIHPYYTVALAPAIAALVATTSRLLWARRETSFARIGLALMVAVTAAWSVHLLDSASSWYPSLRYAVAAAGVVATVALLVRPRALRRLTVVLVVVSALAGLGGSAAWAVSTASTPHTGSTPTAGPASAGSGMGGAGAGGGGVGRQFSGTRPSGTAPTGSAPTGTGTTGTTRPGSTGATTSGSTTGSAAAAGGGGDTASAAVVALLEKTTTTWAAATVGSQSAAPLELASNKAVMAIGGFTGSDATPTLAAFKAYVAAGRIHYFIAGSTGGGDAEGTSSVAAQITAWVEANYTATTVGGSTVYDLTATG